MIFLIIPTYNNQQTLPALLAAVQVASVDWGQPYRALVVDDNSVDDTPDMVLDFGNLGNFELVRHQRHQGEGAALKTGLGVALKSANPADYIITLCVQNALSPSLVKPMVTRLDEGCDVVVASRFAQGGRAIGLSALDRIATALAARFTNLLFPIPNLRDTASRCQAYRARVLDELAAQYGDYYILEQDCACWLELLWKASSLDNVRFAEVPLVMRYDLLPDPDRIHAGSILRQQTHIISRNWRYK